MPDPQLETTWRYEAEVDVLDPETHKGPIGQFEIFCTTDEMVEVWDVKFVAEETLLRGWHGWCRFEPQISPDICGLLGNQAG